ncbi:MAG: hypothetical protein M3331_05220 [Actinomycetota bacterium]|nr:hypothetical protein [Actinomycetota bacterium]
MVFRSPVGRVRDGHFKVVIGSPDTGRFLRLVGDLKRTGKAVGVFRYRNDFGAHGVCDTGLHDWVAFKQ